MPSLRNPVISMLRLAGATNIAAAVRRNARNPTRLLTIFDVT
jgi:hypothetical protein